VIYADSSAVLAWLLNEPSGDRVSRFLRPPSPVIVSDLTLIECDRAIHRLAQLRPADAAAGEELRLRLAGVAAGWAVEPVSSAVVQRARARFPDDAIRSVDAIHLATAIVARDAVGEIDVLSLDGRVRSCAAALGFRVVPD
jgi:predicted nucleic acid-binding protein